MLTKRLRSKLLHRSELRLICFKSYAPQVHPVCCGVENFGVFWKRSAIDLRGVQGVFRAFRSLAGQQSEVEWEAGGIGAGKPCRFFDGRPVAKKRLRLLNAAHKARGMARGWSTDAPRHGQKVC